MSASLIEMRAWAVGAAITRIVLFGGPEVALGQPTPMPVCAKSVRDQATGNCVQVSSAPALNFLYPLGPEFNIDGATGNVGIGITNPTERLTVAGGRINPSGTGVNTGIQFSHLHLFEDDDLTLKLRSAGGYNVAFLQDGFLGIGVEEPTCLLHVERNVGFDGALLTINDTDAGNPSRGLLDIRAGNMSLLYLGGDDGDGYVTSPSGKLHLSTGGGFFERVTIDAAGNVGIGTIDPTTKLDVAGEVRAGCLTVKGGCDIAEPFDITDPGVQPGFVVSIDRRRQGALRIATNPYDTAVAGVVSGAGGVRPGLTLTQVDVLEGDHLVALSGRVYCWCDASFGPIHPGDLLTTSTTPGHAMRALPEQAAGAIVGKALTPLETGRGLVLIVVTCQ